RTYRLDLERISLRAERRQPGQGPVLSCTPVNVNGVNTTHGQEECDMNRRNAAVILGFLLCAPLAPAAFAQGTPPAITEEEAHAIGVDAYLYFYSLISMDITRLTSTNVEAGKEPLKAPMNMFVSAAAYPPG